MTGPPGQTPQDKSMGSLLLCADVGPPENWCLPRVKQPVHHLALDMAMGQNPNRTPSPTKIGSMMGGEFTYPNMGSPWLGPTATSEISTRGQLTYVSRSKAQGVLRATEGLRVRDLPRKNVQPGKNTTGKNEKKCASISGQGIICAHKSGSSVHTGFPHLLRHALWIICAHKVSDIWLICTHTHFWQGGGVGGDW